MKKALVLATALMLTAGTFFFWYDSDSRETKPKLKLKTERVKEGPLTVKISATGVVEPNFQVEVKSKASGRVLSFPFEEGDRVKKGELLLQLDKTDELHSVAKIQADLQSAAARLKKAEVSLVLQKNKYETDVRRSVSEVEAAQANLKESEDKLKRQQDLFEQKIAARETLDAARTAFKINQENLVQARARLEAAKDSVNDIAIRENEVELARADVKRAEVSVEEANIRLSETEIYAPISGVVTKKLVEQGQIISSGITTFTGGTALCTVADLSRLFITADVDETDIGSIRLGQPVSITADAFQGQTFEGKVTRIAPQGVVQNKITIFKVKIEILGNGKEVLKPMMTANVDIVTRHLENALYLPREAVWKEAGESYAAVFEGGEPKKIPVTAGVQNLTQTQILSGVKKDQEVILGDWKKIMAEQEKGPGKMSTVNRILWIIRSK
ncbi:MAG: efflux RND transporter periplasmic adaptor subunit [Nitrospinae bacterium]|nr:efflux RND transporter periplasmic adaptor subunit [Nitrospinota bacterium]